MGKAKAIGKILGVIDLINGKMMFVSGFIMLAMTLGVTYEVIMRYFFNAPTRWAFELNIYLLCACALLAGGYCLLQEGHVRVDILYVRFSPRTKAIIDLVTSILFFCLCIVLIWKGGEMAWESLVQGKHSSEAMGWPLFPSQVMVPIGGVLIGLQGVAKWIRDLRVAIKGEQAKELLGKGS